MIRKVNAVLAVIAALLCCWMWVKVQRQTRLLAEAAAVIEQQGRIIDRCMDKQRQATER
jgi:hypothetical protein